MSTRSSKTSPREASGLLSAVMASTADALIACSLEGQIEEWNDGAAAIYGYSRDEALGKNIALTAPAELENEVAEHQAAARQGRPLAPLDTVRVRKSGESFPVAIRGCPVRDESGEIVGYVTAQRDISHRVRSADALRTALAETQEASVTKSRFLANASHELRTPMNAIVGMTALALEEEISHELRDYLETIRESADAMLNLINDILDLTKFESERFELDHSPFSLRELVEGTIKVLGSAAHAKGLELVCHVAPETPSTVVGDPGRLRQVLTNLVGNAIKFTAVGEVVVDVTQKSTNKTRTTLNFRVVDTGIGISEEDQTRIFAPFTQVDAATTRRYSGTGLGLTITQHLIDCFGSELCVESKVGEGSCFSFDLTMPLSAPAEYDPTGAADRLRGLTVLVVDDNESSREALVEQFEAWGMTAEAVSSGQEAIDRLASAADSGTQYDLTVIDALMPGVDGFAVAAQIERSGNITSKPIIMASTTDRLEFSKRCAEAGAVAFIQKPTSQSQLLGAVVQASGAASLDPPSRQRLFDRPFVHPLRVLLVEDTPANRKVAQKVLTKRGHHLEIAVNGREAVDAFRKQEFDVVLMDIQMPIMDGLQATEAIRAMEQNSERTAPTPIIAMTAHSMRGDHERCLRAGMDGYLAKPLDLAKFIRAVECFSEDVDENKADIDSVFEKVDFDQATPDSIDSPAAGAARAPTVHLEAALARLRGDRSLLMDMIGFYEEDAPALLTTVRQSLTSEDLEGLQRAAHSLKGLAATFDAEEAVAAARDVEFASRDGRKRDLPEMVQRLEDESAGLMRFFQDYRTRQSS